MKNNKSKLATDSKNVPTSQRLSGAIVSTKMAQTAVIRCERLKRHPKYKKTYRVSKKYKAHNPDNKYQEGDMVIIQSVRPLSKDKRWLIVEKVSGKESISL